MLMITATAVQSQESATIYVTHIITAVDSLGAGQYQAQIEVGNNWGLIPKRQGKVYGRYTEENPDRNVEIGISTINSLEEKQAGLLVQLTEGHKLLVGDAVFLPSQFTPPANGNSDLFKLLQLHLTLLDTANKPLFSREEVWQNDTEARQRAVEKRILGMLKTRSEEVKAQLEKAPASGGYFKGQNMYEIVQQLTLTDVRSFLRYIVAANPLKYMSNKWSSSRELLIWAGTNTYNTSEDLQEIYLEKPKSAWENLDKRYTAQITATKIDEWVTKANEQTTLGKHVQAKNILELALYHYKKQGNANGELVAIAALAKALLEEGKAEEGKQYLAQALASAKAQQASPATILNLYTEQSKVYDPAKDSVQLAALFKEGRGYSRANSEVLGKDKTSTDTYIAFVDAHAAWLEQQKDWEGYIKLRKEEGQTLKGWGITYNQLGSVLWNVGYGLTEQRKHQEALDAYYLGLSYYDSANSNNDRYAIGRSQQFIADRHWSLKQYDSAYWYAQKGVAILERMNAEFPNQTAIYNELGSSYDKWGDKLYTEGKYEEALAIYTKGQDYYGLLLELNEELDQQRSYGNIIDDLADAYVKLERYEEAVQAQEKRLAHHQQYQDSAMVASTHWDLASMYDGAGLQEYDKAIAYTKLALAYHESQGNIIQQSQLLQNLNIYYRKLERYQEAIEVALRSIEVLKMGDATNADILREMGDSYDNLATVYSEQEKYAEELETLQQELDIRRKQKDEEEIADVYWDIGIAKASIHQYEEANDNYQEALRHYETLEARQYRSEGLLFGNIAANNAKRHQYDSAAYYDTKAVESMEMAAKEDSSIENVMNVAEYQARLAKRYALQANAQQLAKWTDKALTHHDALLKEHNNDKGLAVLQAEVLDILGEAYAGINDFYKAAAYQKQRSELLKDKPQLLASAYFDIADAYYSATEYPEAIEYYLKAERQYLQVKDTSNAAVSISNQAQAYWGMGALDKSIKAHLRSVALAEASNDIERLAFAWKALASIYQQSGQVAKGEAAFDKALDYYKQIDAPEELFEAYNDMADLYERKANYSQARHYYSEALQIAKKTEDTFKQAAQLNAIGSTYGQEFNFREAANYHQQAFELAKRTKNFAGEANALVYLGSSHVQNNAFDKAYKAFDQAIAIAKKVNLFSILGYSQRRKAAALINQGKYEEAKKMLEASLAMYQTANDQSNQGNVLRDIGWLEVGRGETALALSLYDSALQIAKILQNPEHIAISNSMMADVYIYLGDYEKAKSLHEASLGVFQQYKYQWGIAGTYNSLGHLESSFGRYEKAIDYYTKADSFYIAIGDQLASTSPTNATGVVYYWQGDYEKSLKYFDKAIKTLDSLGIKSTFRNTLSINKAEILVEMKQYEEANRLLQESFKNATALQDISNQAGTQTALGNLELHREDYPAAIEYLKAAYELDQKIKSKSQQLRTTAFLGKAYFFNKNIEEANRFFETSIALHEAIGAEKHLWEALYYKGLIAKEAGKTEEATQYLTRAVDVLEKIQNKLVGGEEAKKLFAAGAEKVKVYDALINVLIGQGKVSDALQYLERSNNQELRNRIRQTDINFKDKGKTEVIKKERSLQSDIDQLDTKIAQEKNKAIVSHTRIKQLEATRSVAEKEYQKFAMEIMMKKSELHSHLSIRPSEFKPNKNMIPEGVAMVSYLPGETQLYIFVATADTLVAKEINISRKELFQAIKLVTNFCKHKIEDEAFSAKEDLMGGSVSLSYSNKESDFNKYAEVLYDALIAPIEPELKGIKQVGIVPSGILHFLPFQMIGYTAESGRFMSLIEQHSIFYASSLIVLYQSQEEKKVLKVLAMGNADGTLPATEAEVALIKDYFPTAKVYIGKEATEQIIKADHADYNVLHFATHGTLDAYDPFKSHLVLSAHNTEEDGDLTVEEVFEFGLQGYELVTLSACQTAVPMSENEWPINPATGFLGAGAKTVIGSLWKVNDEATGKMMGYFYQKMQEGMDKVDALRAAQIKVSQTKGFEHPHFWAPFVLIGNWK